MLIKDTSNLQLRHFNEEDSEKLLSIVKLPEVMAYSLRGVLNLQGAREFIKRRIYEYEHPGFSYWAVLEKNNGKLIGYGGISPKEVDGYIEIAFSCRLHPDYWNQGYEFEIAQACKDYAFNRLAFNKIACLIVENDTWMQGIADKLQMEYEKDSLFGDKKIRVYGLHRFKP